MCIIILIAAVGIPFFARIFLLLQEYGFYNLEAIGLSVASIIYLIPYWFKKKKESSWIKILVLVVVVVISVGTIVVIFQITGPYNLYVARQYEAMCPPKIWNGTTWIVGNGTAPDVFLNSTMYDTTPQNASLRYGAQLYEDFTYDSAFAGVLGMFFGLFSVLATVIGSRFKIDEDTKDLAKTLISTIALLSIATSLITFAANSQNYVYSAKNILAVMSLLLATLFLALGFLIAPPTRNRRGILSIPQSIVLVISFAFGFTYGAMLMPFTRAVIYFPPQSQIVKYFTAYPGVYFFAYSAMITLALLLYILHDQNAKPKRKTPRIYVLLASSHIP